jgi:gluconolactonase
VASGIGFTEGPVWTHDGRLLVTSMSRGLVFEVALDGAPARPLIEPGGGPNGLAEDADGVLWIAQNGGTILASRSQRPVRPSLQRWDGGEVEDLAVDGLDGPNDCVLAPDGRIWFTDPRGRASAEGAQPGRLCAYDPASGALTVLRDGLRYPNGLAFGLDPADFFLAETLSRRILRFRVGADGALSEPETFAELPVGEPDGIAFDVRGRLHVAATTADCVVVLDADGSLAETLELGPSFPTNLCFGGPDGRTLLVTAGKGGRVLAVERDVPGLPLPRP